MTDSYRSWMTAACNAVIPALSSASRGASNFARIWTMGVEPRAAA